MIGGFNSEIEHNGTVFHIQTEDKGRSNPVIESLIYVGGQVVVSRRDDYGDLVERQAPDQEVGERMDRQHRLMIAAIKSGRFDSEFDALIASGRVIAEDAGSSPLEDVERAIGALAPRQPSDSAVRRGREIETEVNDDDTLDEIVLRYLNAESSREHLVLALEENGELRMGRNAFLALKARSSRGGAAVEGAEVQVKMISTVREPQVLGRGVTDADGECFLNVRIPAIENAVAALIISASSDIGTAEVKQLL
jgi:hypothetical protein